MGHAGEYRARIHRPKHLKQRLRDSSGRLIGCTDTCLAMYGDAVTFGAVRVTEAWVRRHSTEPTPDPVSPGLNISQIREVARNDMQLHLYDGTGKTWSQLVALLDQNRRVIAQLWYDDLPGGTAIGHALLLQARRVRPGAPAGWEILANDPLKTAEDWYLDDHVRRAMESFGRRTGLTGGQLRFAYGDPLAYIADGAD